MRSTTLLSAVALLASLQSVTSLSTNVKPGQSECFLVTTTPETPCFGSFEILSSEPESLSIVVRGPQPVNKLIHESRYQGVGAIDRHETEGSFSFTADLEGDYSLCIRNEEQSEEKLVAFNFRCVEIAGDIDYEFASMQSELFDLQRGLNFLKDHQSFMNQREDRHRAILESTNFKVLGWTILEAVILIGMAFWQIAYISKFFETKRKM
jgi:p24 family protein beta-1